MAFFSKIFVREILAVIQEWRDNRIGAFSDEYFESIRLHPLSWTHRSVGNTRLKWALTCCPDPPLSSTLATYEQFSAGGITLAMEVDRLHTGKQPEAKSDNCLAQRSEEWNTAIPNVW